MKPKVQTISQKETRDVVSVKLSDNERRIIDEAISKVGGTRSGFIRFAAINHAAVVIAMPLPSLAAS